MIFARKVSLRVRRCVERLSRLVRSIHLKAGMTSLGFGVPSRRSISSVISTKSWSSCSSALFIPLRPMNRLPLIGRVKMLTVRASRQDLTLTTSPLGMILAVEVERRRWNPEV